METIIRKFVVAAFGLVLGGCVATSPNVDRQFGNAVNLAKAQQTINPDASKNTNPVAGIDGESAKEGMERYHDSFKAPPPTFNIITIGGADSAGR